MGEAFKLHSQALIGYEDEITPAPEHNVPSMTTQNFGTMELAY